MRGGAEQMIPTKLAHRLAVANHPGARAARRLRKAVVNATLPAPRVAFVPVLQAYLGVRSLYWYLKRLLVAEPLFKAYCARCGRGVRTGVYVHFVEGHGRIEVGDEVLVDGRCAFTFAARFSPCPTLTIGDYTSIAHNCSFTIADRISIGRGCMVAGDVVMFDSPGHAVDPVRRAMGLPPTANQVRPITIGDNVWIGRGAIICPGVTIGDNSVISAGSVVAHDVPANTLVLPRRQAFYPIGGSAHTPAPVGAQVPDRC
jgi:acetyltransferase-like isoleucine patch superfamily enzyme